MSQLCPQPIPPIQLQQQLQLLASWVRSNLDRIRNDAAIAARLVDLWETHLKDYRIELAEMRASDKQRSFWADFFSRKYRTYAALGANRSGKSVVAAAAFCRWMRDYARDGDEFWCVAPSSEKSIGQQKFLYDFLPRHMFGDDQTYSQKYGFGRERPTIELTLPNSRGKCVIRFKTSEQDASTFEQGKLSGCWCDERLPKEIYDRLIPRMIDMDGWILYSDIPEQDWHWFDLVNAKPEARVLCQIFCMRDNAHNLPAGAIELARARLSKDEADMRIEGKFRRLSGVVYQEFDRDLHIVKPFRIPLDWPRFRVLDYGGSAPTACLWLALSEAETIYVYREYYQPGGSIAIHAKAIKDKSFYQDPRTGLVVPETFRTEFIDPHAFDISPANEVNIATQYAQYGFAFIPWPLVNVMGEHAMVERVKYKLTNNQIKVFTTCVNTIREFQSWKYKVDRDGRPLASDAFERGNNHALDGIKGFVCTNQAYRTGKVKSSTAY